MAGRPTNAAVATCRRQQRVRCEYSIREDARKESCCSLSARSDAGDRLVSAGPKAHYDQL